MSTSPFRTTAVTCTILAATLGAGFATPLTANAAVEPRSSASVAASPIDGIPVDPSIAAPVVRSITNTTTGASAVMGTAGDDDVYLLAGDEIVDRSVGDGGLFQLFAQDRDKDKQLDMVRVHKGTDGTETRSERIPMPRTLQVAGLRDTNTFTPGTRHFSGSATAGATITATDKNSGKTMFTATAGSARSAAGTWNADADLAANTDYDLTFTQRTTDGRSTVMSGIAFTAETADAPAAPTVESVDRRLDGAYVVTGTVADGVASVEATAADGTPITSAKPDSGAFALTIPAGRVGQTIDVVATTADATSPSTPVQLRPLPVDSSTSKPALRDVHVQPNGNIQVIGERQKTDGLWVMDGDQVVASFPAANDGWSFTIDQRYTGKQLDLVALHFDGTRFSATSERVALPRLLQVDGVGDENSYAPGVHEFTGTAEAGATITATDQDDNVLFTAKTTTTRAGTATWRASADLTSTDGYTVTFTQTTADGRTSTMQDIPFTADETRPFAITTPTAGSDHKGEMVTFTGTGSPEDTVTLAVTNFASQDVTTQVESDGTWKISRWIGTGAYTFTATQTDATGATTGTITDYRINHPVKGEEKPFAVNGPTDGSRFTPDTFMQFTGTGPVGADILVDPGPGLAPVRTTVGDNGDWSVKKYVGNGRYTFTITMTPSTGSPQTATPITTTPTS
ncbi:hypothetical protein KK101_16280 [Curtobacterium flaccumfaciens pv. oortii]|uniref:hypothetical protein n=1 Tax=Curtobacterium flaccumfaciens TaxID=2035 RepID=UPI001BDF11C0|nr:hypothetical protein [Curtobacterium flaccumfaciens]MBT1624253.1 hypothetical protein [Curtobacterium flaccumfaciens pv. oortii]